MRLLATIITAWLVSTAAPLDFTPRFERAILDVEGTTLRTLHVRIPALQVYQAGSLCLTLAGDKVIAIDGNSGNDLWSVRSPENQILEWLGATDETAFLKGQSQGLVAVHCLELKTRRWLTPLLLTEDKSEFVVVDGLVANGQWVSLLTRSFKEGYYLTGYKIGQSKPLWNNFYSIEGKRPEPGAYLLSVKRPDYATENIRSLSLLSDQRLLLCAGPKETLRAIDITSGREIWQQERLWEYERGFTGPSVWQHHIGRFGDLYIDATHYVIPQEKIRIQTRFKAAREEFEKRFEAAIIGGPVVVSSTETVDTNTRIFVAVAKGLRGPWSGYLSDCVIYELGSDGRVLGMVTLPRLALGKDTGISDGGLVWACQSGGVVRLTPDIRNFPSMGPGGYDGVTRIEWYQELRAPERKAWLKSDPAGNVNCFTDQYLFRVTEGGFVTEESEGTYHFPITVINLKSGRQRSLILKVPFDGDLGPPGSNYIRTANSTHIIGPHKLAITGLQKQGTILRVRLGMEKATTGLEFNLGDTFEK